MPEAVGGEPVSLSSSGYSVRLPVPVKVKRMFQIKLDGRPRWRRRITGDGLRTAQQCYVLSEPLGLSFSMSSCWMFYARFPARCRALCGIAPPWFTGSRFCRTSGQVGSRYLSMLSFRRQTEWIPPEPTVSCWRGRLRTRQCRCLPGGCSR